MFGLLPDRLYKGYRNFLSDYYPDKREGKWPHKFIENVDVSTGEVIQEKPVYICKPENIGQRMSIDDKAISRDGYTILSNTETNKIAMMIESTDGKELEKAMSFFGETLLKIKSISSDMDPTYLRLCREQIPCAKIVIDKFHVIRYVYEAVLDVRLRIRKRLAEELSSEKKKTEKDKEILREIALLNRCRNRLTQSVDKWSETTKELMKYLFNQYEDLHTAYLLSQRFKRWYDINSYENHNAHTQNLWHWYNEVKKSEIEEFLPVVKMIRKHEDEILNYFLSGHTSAAAERLNGKIERFVSANYGMRDKDFSLYRMTGYFS